MIGAWSKFGTGALPDDGEAIVVIDLFSTAESLIEGVKGKASPAVYKYGSLYTQDGASMPTPYGAEWTSLPHPSVKAYGH
jgi:hypothetical protein